MARASRELVLVFAYTASSKAPVTGATPGVAAAGATVGKLITSILLSPCGSGDT
jgi:hypothetical protein